MSDPTALGPRAIVPWRALVLAALLSLALGAALYEGLAGGHSSATSAGHFRASSHLRSRASSHKLGLSGLPPAAQGPISEALGAENPAYRATASGGGFAASNPAQRLTASFGRSGVSVRSGAARVGLSLRAVGYGSSLSAVGAVAPRVRANRISYERAGLSEWFANGPLGLEQGFTIARAPAAQSAGALTLSLALSGNTHASLGAHGQSIAFSRSGHTALRYSGLSASDARGRALHSWLELKGGRILLRVDARGARYPLRIDPFVQQGEKLAGSGTRGEEGAFGYSVAISSEKGEYALIGGPSDNGKVGAAWVFLRTGTTWAQQGTKLTAKEEAGASEFGKSVALSSEGNYALIGGSADNEKAGAAWVFLRTATTWAQQAKLTAKTGEEVGAGELGESVSLSATGEYAVVGAPGDNGAVGAAWVFLRSGTTWGQQGAKLTAKSGEETGAGQFGYSVAVAAKEGNYALIGAPMNKEGTGAAWVFFRETGKTTWGQQAMLTGTGELNAAEFGKSVALSAEGNNSLIGGPQNGEGVGAAWVWTRSVATWTFQAELTAKSGEEVGKGEFGYSVAIASKEGNYALVGAPVDNTSVGAAWVFFRETGKTTWSQQGGKLTGSPEGGAGLFGYSVALSSEGNYALMGGVADGKEVGAAWVSLRTGTSWAQQAKLTGSGEIREGESGGKGAAGYSVALSSEGNYAVIGGPSDNYKVGAAWVFLRTGTTWSQQAKLTAKTGEETGAAEFGKSVAISAEGNYALIGAPGDNGAVGSGWVFFRETGKTSWAQQAKLTAKSGEETGAGGFGASVAISGEGNYAVIGSPSESSGVGSAWAFFRETGKTTWTQQGAKLTGKEENGDAEFGYSVAIASKEGNYALIGGPQNKEGTGAAWVFLRTGTSWGYQATLTGKEESGAGQFGKSVALSATGEYALVGGPENKESLGAAWVLTRSGATWSAQAELTPKTEEETGAGEFGASVAIASKEGNYAVIGAPSDNKGVGAAWAYFRETGKTTWTQQGAKLTGSGENGASEFGKSVAISAEGNYALMGGFRDSKEIGAAWVYLRTGTAWAEQGEKLTAKEELGEGEQIPGLTNQGFSVALSGEGNTALIGGPAYDGNVGAAWVFTRSGSTWTQQGPKLTAGGESGAGQFGDAVALSSTGEYALIGGYRDNEGVGAAWVFTRSGSTWTQQGQKLTAKSGEESGAGQFGTSVALSSEGTTALIGGPAEGLGFSLHYGAAWVFVRETGKTTWAQQGEKLQGPTGEVENGEFASSVALSANGNTALIGGPGNSKGVGAAWVYTRSGSTWTEQGGALAPSGETGAGEVGSSVALSAEGNTALIGGPADSTSIGAAWVFTRSGSVWTQFGSKLTGSGESGTAEFGFSVALSANGNTALMGGPNDSANAGAAWVFTHSGSAFTQLGSKLTGSGEVGEGLFGWSVALSSEGNTALIGGYGDSGTVGAGWVFVNSSPTVETKAASAVTQTTATLNASVNPDGVEVSKCELEYGTTTEYKSTPVSCSSPPGSGTSAVAVSAPLTGLTANTTYHFRISATNANGTSKGADETFRTPINPPTVVSEKASTVTQTSATLNATVNPNGGEVTECKFEYGTTTEYKSTPVSCSSPPGSGTSAVAVSAPVTGLTANTTYHFRISATNSSGTSKGSDETLKTPANAPTVVTEKASTVTQTSATLNASVNPNGGEVTECKFEYGTTTEYKSTPVSCSSLPGSGTSAVAVSAPVTGLTANTTYHFRISATNASGTSKGSDETLKTVPNAPTVVTEKATSVTQTTAMLSATVNPNGGEVSECKFEYGTTTEYKSTPVSCSSLPGNGTSAVAVSAPLTGLTANTTYHFRISATNAGGTSKGSDEAFKTTPSPPTVVTEPASSITQTAATIKATVNPNGGEVSKCEFEYGTTTEYKSTPVSCSSLPGSGTSAVAVSAPLTGLTANTTYHFRISATNASGTSKGADETLTTLPNAPTVVTKPASSVTQATATLNATVNPNGGEVSECKFEYGTTTEYKSTPVSCSSLPGSGTSPVAVSASATGLTANTTYHFRISATNAGGTTKGSDQEFKTPVNAPTVVSEPASSITQTAATLKATVNPNGGEVSECKFEYGTTTEYKSTPVSCSSLPGSGTSAVAVSAPVTGLTANTTYHFRISATNSSGTSKGSDETLKTLPNAPTVVTEKATSVTQTTATLNATVNPNGGEVSECKFEYGTTNSYGSSESCSSLPGAGSSPVAVSESIAGLSPNTTYHFRISATNAGGTSKGSDETFKTAPSPPTVVTEPASSITQTAATLKATVNPNGGEISKCEFEYGTTKSYGSTAPCSSLPGSGTSPVAVSASATGLAANTLYHFRISATNASGTSKGADQKFETPPNPPTVVTGLATFVTQTSASLNASVNPNGGAVSECKLEYGPTNSYGQSAPCAQEAGSGSLPVLVSAEVTGLTPNTTYHFRISATNPGGTSKGSDETFKTTSAVTPPTVVTKAASAVTQTSATLNATVNPNGGEVSECKFEYGTTKSYGHSVSCSMLPGSGSSPVAVSASLTGLTADAVYHYRISATNPSGTSKGADQRFTTDPPIVVSEAATSITQTSATLNATVNPGGEELSECTFEYGTTTAYGQSAPCSSLPEAVEYAVAVSAQITGLTANTTYHFRISATNPSGPSKGSDETFRTLPNPPTVVTEPASSITQTTASLKATVNPNAGEVSKCEFEYGTTTAYGSSASCSSLPGAGTSPVAVSAAVSGLAANTTYHFRISATNAGGTSKGADETFKTPVKPPTVVSEKATAIAQTTATLNGTVNPNGGEVSECKFEYGTTTEYKSTPVSCSSLPGNGTSAVAVSAPLTGLSANTTYHFRISATNAGGTSKGSDETFTTLPNCTAEGFCTSFTPPNNIEGSFREPDAVALDPSGNIWIADSGHDRVIEFNSKHEYLRQFGSEGTAEGQFKAISGLAANAAGDVYVTDYGNNRVQEFSPSGAFLRQFGSKGTEAGQFYDPTAIAVDPSGNVWVLNSYGVEVQEFSATGELLSGFGSATGWFGTGDGLAFSGGNLYVSEAIAGRVQEYSTAGASIRVFDEAGTGNGKSKTPWGIASDPKTGNLYVTETGNDRVQEFSAAGSFIAAFGSPGSGAGQFSLPKGIALGSSSTVYVADTANNRIEEWAAAKVAGEPPTYATSFTPPNNVEGSFREPDAVALDPSGNIWIADSGHDRVIEFNSKHEYLRQFGSEGTAEGQFKAISGLAANAAGDVYVTDYGNNRVQEFSPSGGFLRQFGYQASEFGQLINPTAIAVDPSGNVWVLNSYGVELQEFSATGEPLSGFGSATGWFGGRNGLALSGGNLYVSESLPGRVQEYSTAGASIRVFDEAGTGNGKSKTPWGIASDPKTGNLYVTETGNDRVQEFSAAGSFIAAFGSPGSGAGQLSAPKGIAVGSSSTVYVADTANNRIEEWMLP